MNDFYYELSKHFYNVYFFIIAQPLVIKIAVCCVIIFTLGYFVFLGNILVTKLLIDKRKIREKKLFEQYNDKLHEILLSDKIMILEEIENVLPKNSRKLSKKDNRLLSKIIIDILEENPQFNTKNLEVLLAHFNLKKFWENELEYSDFQKKYKAIDRVNQLKVSLPSESIISRLTYSKNKLLRKKARAAYIHMTSNDPFRFFTEDFDKEVTDWDKITLHEMLLKLPKSKIPNFSQWINTSKNNALKAFYMYEIYFYNQRAACPFVLAHFETNDLELRKTVVDVLGKMKYKQAEKKFIEEFPNQPLVIQNSIIKAVARFKNPESLEFLKQAFLNAYNNESKITIAKALYNFSKEANEFLEENKVNEKDYFQKLIIEHIKNPLIVNHNA